MIFLDSTFLNRISPGAENNPSDFVKAFERESG